MKELYLKFYGVGLLMMVRAFCSQNMAISVSLPRMGMLKRLRKSKTKN